VKFANYNLARFSIPAGLSALLAQSMAIFFMIWIVGRQLGSTELGLYSLLAGSITILSLTEFGIGTSMISFSQIKSKRPEHIDFSPYYTTALLFAIMISIIFVIISYWPLQQFLITQMPNERLENELTRCLIPVIFTAAFIAIGKVPINALNGIGLFVPAQFIRTFSYIILIPMCYYGLITDGLYGVMISRLIVEVIIVVSSHIIVYLAIPTVRLIPLRFGKNEFYEMIRISASFQTSSILLILFEPLAKVAISVVGTLDTVAQYEIAARLTGFVKELFIRPLAFLGGTFSRYSQLENVEKIKTLLSYLTMISLPLTALSLSLVFLTLDPISTIMIDGSSTFFFVSSISLAIGWAFSIIAAGAYFYCIGTGYNTPNLISAMLISLCSAGFSLLAMFLDIVWLVPFGTGLSLIIGEVFLVMSVFKNIGTSFLSHSHIDQFITSLIISTFAITVYFIDYLMFSDEFSIFRIGMLSLYCLVMITYLYFKLKISFKSYLRDS
jgi:hypothetical protein